MGSYRNDSDRFHAEREARDEELAQAATFERLVELLEQRGVDVDAFLDGLTKANKALERIGVDIDIRRSIYMKAFELKLGISEGKDSQ